MKIVLKNTSLVFATVTPPTVIYTKTVDTVFSATPKINTAFAIAGTVLVGVTNCKVKVSISNSNLTGTLCSLMAQVGQNYESLGNVELDDSQYIDITLPSDMTSIVLQSKTSVSNTDACTLTFTFAQ